MEKIWSLRFLSMLPINPIQLYFADEAAAKQHYAEYAHLLVQKPDGECECLVCEDLLGHHVLRPSLFPYCYFFEISAAEVAWKSIDDSIKAIKAEVGKVNQAGFTR